MEMYVNGTFLITGTETVAACGNIIGRIKHTETDSAVIYGNLDGKLSHSGIGSVIIFGNVAVGLISQIGPCIINVYGDSYGKIEHYGGEP